MGTRVQQSLAESQIAKKNFLELKRKAEVILSQLQEEARQSNYSGGHSNSSSDMSQVPVYATVRKDRRRDVARGGKVTRNMVVETETVPEESPYQLRPRSLMLSYKH